MSKLLDGLNASQQKAVTHTDGPLLIIAGPGLGKTRTVARSITYAIENLGVGPSQIAAFTFTNKAKDDLKKRISNNIVRQDLVDDIWIRTFHSFCGRVVKEDFDPFGIENERELTVKKLILLQKERVRAEIDYIQHRNFPDPDDVLRFITQCKERNINSADVKDYVPDPQMVDVYIDIEKKYEQLTDDGNPYTRVQLLTDVLFRDFPEVRRKWQEKFDLIFVDEYQNTDLVQYRIIKTLAEKHQNLRVVGDDDDQGIYSFGEADIQNIPNFEKDYSTAKISPLGQNYRSTQRIVDASRALAEFNSDRRETELFTQVEEPLESITRLPTRSEIVLGIDPGNILGIDHENIGTRTTNVGWSITEKSSNGYTVIDCSTETPKGTSVENLKQIEDKINELIDLHRPDAIAVEKLEGARKKRLIGVAGCVALVRSMADQHGIECAFYSPQQVKYAATGQIKADKPQVQEGVKKRCDFSMVQNSNNIDDHSADAIAVSLCYLDSYLNSSRLQWKKRKQKQQEHYDSGLVHLSNGQYEAAVIAFKKACALDPNNQEVWANLGRAYYLIDEYVNAANCYRKVTDLDPKDKNAYSNLGNAYFRMGAYADVIEPLQKACALDPNCGKFHYYLGRAQFELDRLEEAKRAVKKALESDQAHHPTIKLLKKIEKRSDEIIKNDNPDMILIPAGEFQMGCGDRDAPSNEKPMHTVYLGDFYIDKYPVTNAQYKRFIDANPQWRKDHIPRKYHNGGYLKDWKRNDYLSGTANHPVVHVSWYAAMAYAQWIGKHLPTEAEWEKAARGGLVSQIYPWGNLIDSSKANYNKNVRRTTSVGDYPANNYGLYDMAGNVWEWCLDRYNEDFYVKSPRHNPVAGGTLRYTIDLFRNIKSSRVLRGGSWSVEPQDVRSTARTWASPNNLSLDLGFRCVMSVIP